MNSWPESEYLKRRMGDRELVFFLLFDARNVIEKTKKKKKQINNRDET